LIYFLRLQTGAIKIGYTRDIEQRLQWIDSWYGGSPTELLALIPGDKKTERDIHVMFRHLRFGTLEQFRPGRDLMEYIGLSLPDGLDPLSVEEMKPQKKPKSQRGKPGTRGWRLTNDLLPGGGKGTCG
jgi:hypothetical protein